MCDKMICSGNFMIQIICIIIRYLSSCITDSIVIYSLKGLGNMETRGGQLIQTGEDVRDNSPKEETLVLNLDNYRVLIMGQMMFSLHILTYLLSITILEC